MPLPSLQHDNRRVPLQGVPQIPDDVDRTIRIMGEWALTDEQITRAKDAIWEHATKEIQRRHQAAKQGIQLEKYFGFSDAQAEAGDELDEETRYEPADDPDLQLCAGRGLEI